MAIIEIPARKGKAAPVRKGQTVKVINTARVRGRSIFGQILERRMNI